jgi:DNA-binding MarR family transcriptional regulator
MQLLILHPYPGGAMFQNRFTVFPQFVKKIFYDHDISKLKLAINKTQTIILMLVNENNEKSMSEISQMTGLEKSSFTRSVDFLVKNGFIVRKSPENDRRVIKLALTKKGVKAADLIKKDFDEYCESLVSEFTEKEKAEFFVSLDTISKYITMIVAGKQR